VSDVLTPPEPVAGGDAAAPAEISHALHRRGGRLRAMDFSRPTKFTTDQERRIGRVLEAFCRAASTRLSAELRAPLDLELVGTSQLNWAHAHGQLPAESVCGVVEARPVGTTLLLVAEPPLVLRAIDLLLGGGSSEAQPPARRLTEIDWGIARHFFGSLLGQMSVIWRDMAGLELGLERLETHLETAQVAAVSEPTLALTLEARLGGDTSSVVLLVPYGSVAGVMEQFSRDVRRAEDDDPGLAEAVQGAVRGVDVTVRAEVAAVDLPAEAVLALRPGDLVRLGGRAADGVTLFTDGTPVCRVRPGRSGRRRVVQVVDPEGTGA
jgi:flagellar motor switch protein FliM